MRFEANAAVVQLAVQTFDVRFQKRSLDAYRKIADTRVQQALIRDEVPFESRWHADDCNGDWSVGLDGFEAAGRKSFQTFNKDGVVNPSAANEGESTFIRRERERRNLIVAQISN